MWDSIVCAPVPSAQKGCRVDSRKYNLVETCNRFSMVVAIVFDTSVNPCHLQIYVVANSFLPCELVWLAASAQTFCDIYSFT